jgi:glycosyltransferase involved in cell wall biosynthesis
MKILGLAHRMSGCHYHRVTLPLGFMDNVEGLVTDNPVDEILNQEDWDMISFNRTCAFNEQWDRFKGKVVIAMDMDDDWHLPPNHLNYENYERAQVQIEHNLRMSDIVTCTNERLADKIYPFNQNVHIIPNALPYGQDQFHDKKWDDEDGKLRIFWAGGISHLHDLQILRNPMQRLHIHKDKIKMVMGGYTQDNPHSVYLWEKMYSCFTNGGQLPGVRMEGLPPRTYMALYQYGDIMVVPLESSDWHSCKSNLKLLEAGCKGIPCIVSAVEPYIRDKDAPVLWVHQQGDWFKHLNFLINNKNAREDYGEKLKEWAQTNFQLKDHNKRRRELYAGMVAKIRGEKSSGHIDEV